MNAHGRRLLARQSSPFFRFVIDLRTPPRQILAWDDLINVEHSSSDRNKRVLASVPAVFKEGVPAFRRGQLMERMSDCRPGFRFSLRDLLMLSKANADMEKLFRSPENQKCWQPHLDEYLPECEYVKDDVTGICVFDQLIGLLLAGEYEAWVAAGLQEDPRAQKIAEEAESRGICTETIRYAHQLHRRYQQRSALTSILEEITEEPAMVAAAPAA